MKNFEESKMKNENIDELCQKLDAELAKKGLSRRDALKIAGISSAAAMFTAPTASEAATAAIASNAKGKIVIVGAGSAGITVAARLSNALSNADITLIAPNDIHLYQPGQTLVAGKVWTVDQLGEKTKDYIPSGVEWMKDKVTSYDPDNNTVTTKSGKTVKYDYLVMSTGIEYNYEAIEGLTANDIGKDGIMSVYLNNLDTGSTDGCVAMQKQLQEMVTRSKKGEKLTALYSHPNTPIKCGGAPKKVMYLTDGWLRKEGNRDNVEMTFLPNGGKMFGVKEYHEAIVKQYEKRNMKWKYKHNLIKVDKANKVATFRNTYEVEEFDEDLGEKMKVKKHKDIEMKYDYLHVTPPMMAEKAAGTSKLGSAKGWIPVVKETLQHMKYKNVFAIGDIAAVPMGKTGGSVRKQAPVLVQNLIDVMEGKAPSAKYDGYTVCPLITSYGTVMLAEFNWTKKPAPAAPLDPSVERWIWWVLKVYMLRPMYFHGMLRGRA
jgi:sulfide:quinone oxidoreductase